MSYETRARALELKKAKLKSILDANLHRVHGSAGPEMVTDELRRHIVVDEKILKDYR